VRWSEETLVKWERNEVRQESLADGHGDAFMFPAVTRTMPVGTCGRVTRVLTHDESSSTNDKSSPSSDGILTGAFNKTYPIGTSVWFSTMALIDYMSFPLYVPTGYSAPN
jgi:hypothetical protein